MLVERLAVLDDPAPLPEQVVEVQRAGLARRRLAGRERVDRGADDARLDLRARVQADGGGRVEELVVQVVAADVRLRAERDPLAIRLPAGPADRLAGVAPARGRSRCRAGRGRCGRRRASGRRPRSRRGRRRSWSRGRGRSAARGRSRARRRAPRGSSTAASRRTRPSGERRSARSSPGRCRGARPPPGAGGRSRRRRGRVRRGSGPCSRGCPSCTPETRSGSRARARPSPPPSGGSAG